jgi:hypothetical protein
MKLTFILLLSSTWLSAQDARPAGLAAVDRCLEALRAGRTQDALREFASAEQKAVETGRQLAAVRQQGASAALPAATGHSRARHQGVEVLHLFGQAKTASGPVQLHADLIQENNAWRLTRLSVNCAEAGTGRMSPMAIPSVTEAVNSMVTSETVINGFFAALARGEYQIAAACWVPGKVTADQLKAFAAAQPEMVRGFHRVEEGRTNFNFERDPAGRVIGVGANGKLAYDEGRTMKSFRGRVVRLDGGLRIAELDLRLGARYW